MRSGVRGAGWAGHTSWMPVDLFSAAVAGVAVAQVMEGPAYLQKALGLPLRQHVFAEGGVLLGVRGRGRRLVGWVGHAVLAAVIASAYAVLFDLAGEEHLLAWGLLGGLVHFAIGGAVVAALWPVLPQRDGPPALRNGSSGWGRGLSPGFAYRRYGRRDVLTFLGGHLVFGALLAAGYAALAEGLTLATLS